MQHRVFSETSELNRSAVRVCVALALAALWLVSTPAFALEELTILRDGKHVEISGQVEVQGQEGGLLILAPDSVLWSIQSDEIVRRRRTEAPFQLMDRRGLAESLMKELSPGFQTYDTAHYLVCYNTSRAYAQWCGALYERLYRAFHNYWRQRGLNVKDPESPLVALVFRTKADYVRYSRQELAQEQGTIVGYYSLRTNRITTFDLTGLEALSPPDSRGTSRARIHRILSQPNALPTVATIVHEATHQLAYNCGLHQRFADIPLWVSEGIAVYFETPDLKRSKGWRGIGIVSQFRLAQLRRYQRSRPSASLASLISSDRRFRHSGQAVNAYAEAWALCHFLLRQYPEAFTNYLETLAQKPPLIYDSPQQRLEAFLTNFGTDLETLDEQFMRYVDQL